VQFNRRGVSITANIEPSPDWTAAPNYAASLKVAVKRDPRVMAYAVAQARQMIEAGRTASARAVMRGWRKSWRTGAAGQIVQGELLAATKKWKQSLGAYNRARVKDRGNGMVAFGRGVALSALDKSAASQVAFATAGRLDPTDPAAAAFQAYALLQADRAPQALAAARRAVALDPRYADAFVPYGMSLLASGDRANGVVALRRGLLLLEEPERADRLISEHLNPTDP
jgi:tetratricopeptide (TPR) repeat protein